MGRSSLRSPLLLVAGLAAQQAHGFAPAQAPVLRRFAPSAAARFPAATSMQAPGTEPVAAETNKEAEDGSGGVRQLLGLKGRRRRRARSS